MKALAAFGRIDIQNIRREGMLIYILFLPVFLLVTLWFLIPFLTTWALNSVGLDLRPYYFLIATFFFLLETPFAFGLIFGLLVLDERDEGTLRALQTTPFPMRSYIVYRFFGSILVSAVLIIAAIPVSRLVPMNGQTLAALVPAGLVAALIAPLSAAFMPAFARNKVEGLALMKGAGLFLVGPVAAYFAPLPWQLLAGILPTYWPAKAFWVGLEGGNMFPYLIVGTVYLLGVTWLLIRRFQRQLVTR